MHASYTNLGAWSGSETADIVYHDTEGAFTRHLIAGGWLHQQFGQERRPKYNIEVKATTGATETPFFVSQNQWDLMESMKLELTPHSPTDKIYLIARVYNLGKADMRFDLYVDPATQRAEGKLKFSSTKYAVTPARRR